MSEKKIPPPPEKPTPHECCGSGCVPCIYDYYYDALDKWQEQYGTGTIQEESPRSSVPEVISDNE